MSLETVITLPSLLSKLKEAGYETLEEVKETSVYELTQELYLNTEEVKHLIKISGKEPKVKRTIAEIIAAEKENSISTSSKNFDRLFEHGIPPFKITEICGESGSGKTQLCMQLAVNVQLEKKLGGVSGECIYIDTEGSFQISRIVQFAKQHDVERILNGIHYFRVLDYQELISIVRQLPDILTAYPKVKLIVIDSIAFHFRLNVLDARGRTNTLDFIARCLIELANVNQLSVIVTNHVTTDGIDQSWTPSLGSSWGNWCGNRLFLYRKREYRYGYLYKSIENAGSEPVPFCIKDEGIIDPVEDELEAPKQQEENEEEMNNKIESSWKCIKDEGIKQERPDLPLSLTSKPIPHQTPTLNPPLESQTPSTQISDSVDALFQASSLSSEEGPIQRIRKLSEAETERSVKSPKLSHPTIPLPSQDNDWASDLEEELDLDFIQNMQAYF